MLMNDQGEPLPDDQQPVPPEPQVPGPCPQCTAENYTPHDDQAQHDPSCSMAPVAQIMPEEPAPELAATPSDEPTPEPVPEPEAQPPAE
jgi:hypothetical protein